MDLKDFLKNFLKDYGVLLTAFSTFFASLVALFKESINSIFIRPKLVFSELNNKLTVEKSSQSDESSDLTGTYNYKILVSNAGKQKCDKIEVYCERIEYKGNDDVNYNDIDIGSDIQLKIGKNDNVNLAPRGRPCAISVFAISNPNDISEEKDKENINCLLKIGDFIISDDKIGGDYKLKLKCYSENYKPKELLIEFSWNGKWANSIDDFLKHNIKSALSEV